MGSDSPDGLRVAFLTNMVPPYNKPLFMLLSRRYKQFRLFLSTAMESNRPWLPDWEGLDVVVQKGLTLRRSWRHPGGFQEPSSVHFPLDTLSQLGRFEPDVIVSGEMGFRTLLAFVYAKLHPKCRLLIWSEVTPITEKGRGIARNVLRRLLAPRVHGFLALGPSGVRYIRSLGVCDDRIFKIAYSTSLPAFTAIPLERHGPLATRLLFSGQLVSRKGLEPFLEALAGWAEENSERQIEFTIVGDGPERAALTAVLLPPNVKLSFIGSVQYHQLPAQYADAGIFVLPSLADTWAVAVNEALAGGLPVLGSPYSQAVEEMVENSKTGWTFRPDYPDEMRAAIHTALSTSEADLNRMRAHARQASLQVTPRQTADVFENAVRTVRDKI